MTTGVRCEAQYATAVYCSEEAEHIVSRVDARDWQYRCNPHADELHAESPIWEVSAKLSQADLIMALTYWPPKHRSASREDAKRIMAAANAGTVSMEEKG